MCKFCTNSLLQHHTRVSSVVPLPSYLIFFLRGWNKQINGTCLCWVQRNIKYQHETWSSQCISMSIDYHLLLNPIHQHLLILNLHHAAMENVIRELKHTKINSEWAELRLTLHPCRTLNEKTLIMTGMHVHTRNWGKTLMHQQCRQFFPAAAICTDKTLITLNSFNSNEHTHTVQLTCFPLLYFLAGWSHHIGSFVWI